MKTERLVVGKLYELKILGAGVEFRSSCDSVTLWSELLEINGIGEDRVGVYWFYSGPFLVLKSHQDRDEYQILTPDEKIGWVFFNPFMKMPYYFIELLE